MGVSRNLNFTRLLPTVDVRPEFIVICEQNYTAAFLLRVFERKHIFLFDETNKIDSQNYDSINDNLLQKWTNKLLVHELGGVRRPSIIPRALKFLHQKGFIIHKHAKNGNAYLGHDVYFLTDAVQKEIDRMFPIVRQMIETGMGTDKVFTHPKRGRPKGAKNKKSS